MKKKIMALVLALGCVAGAFSAVTAVEQPVSMEAATKKKAPSLSKVYSAVKKAYGSNYLPSYRLSNDEFEKRYAISGKWYSGAIAELPMINVQVDELVIVKAKNKRAKKKIKSALLNYREDKIEDAKHYVGLEKCLASRVYVRGDYVCFICLGSIDQSIDFGTDDSKKIDAYKAENAKAVKAIRKLYQ